MTFGQWLLMQLEAREMTQSDLARATGAGTGAVSKWIADATDPSPRMIVRIAQALRLPVETVLLAVAEEPAAEGAVSAAISLPPRLTEAEAEVLSELAWGLRRVADRRRARRAVQQDEGGRENRQGHL